LKESPIINCHTHVFTGKHVPPYLGKTFLWWPFYYLFNTPLIMWVFYFWFNNKKYSPYFFKYKKGYKKWQNIIYQYKAWVRRHLLTTLIVNAVNALLTLHTLLFLLLFLMHKVGGANIFIKDGVAFITNWLTKNHLLFFYHNALVKIIIILFTFLGINKGRRLIWQVLKKTWSFVGLFPSKHTIQFLQRYINIGRFANYKSSGNIFNKLKIQYQQGTGFVLLPMDMEFMGAGKMAATGHYHKQMEELATIKMRHPTIAFPFVFIDPRRISADANFFKYTFDTYTGQVILQPCFIKSFIEEKKFNGFKIYPALGYYPFDTRLLILWKYAADKQIPITTHVIKGNIFYRGAKQKSWGLHPVFIQSKGLGSHEYEPLLLPQLKNIDFTNNFTHPLNYLCLLEEVLLRQIVSTADTDVKQVFGFTDLLTPLKYNLSHLKVCLAHYGGEEEWSKFFEADRDNIVGNLTANNKKGINFLYNANGKPIPGKIEQVWNRTDWYSIITSLILQFPNVYADISYTLHNESIIPLLKKTLSHPVLQKKVLFGTDFYVVRNYKSEKQLLAELIYALTDEEFNLIAKQNSINFLNLV
jgi:Amidohydrolase